MNDLTISDMLGPVVYTTGYREPLLVEEGEGIVNIDALEESVKNIVWYYVQKALAEAAHNARLSPYYSTYVVNQDSILDAYPKENIK